MGRVTVRVPGALREFSGGEPLVTVDVPADPPPSVAAVLDLLSGSHPALERRIRDETGALREHVNVFVGSDNVRDLDRLSTVIPAGAELIVLPAVSGG
ncbi:MAG TPA: ubiquitin-like small modifier protein 1 [Actinomycetes bacterium]|nr:ubiquitin-like small modifier protein 1 [Actinomycetes bacterium]